MCTNIDLLDSLECYMDDVVDCFQDFVKKSLFVITVIVALLIGMLTYLMKSIYSSQSAIGIQDSGNRRTGIENSGGERAGTNNYEFQTTNNSDAKCRTCVSADKKKSQQTNYSIEHICPKDVAGFTRSVASNTSLQSCCPRVSCKNVANACANTSTISRMPSCDEVVLKNIGLSSCSKSVSAPCRRVTRNCSPRAIVPSQPICKRQTQSCPKPLEPKISCCSVCCDEEDDNRR